MGKTESAKLKSCATTANENQRLVLRFLKKKYAWRPGFLIPKKVRELRDRLKDSVATLDVWGCHA